MFQSRRYITGTNIINVCHQFSWLSGLNSAKGTSIKDRRLIPSSLYAVFYYPDPPPQSSPTAPKNYKERFSNFRPGNLCEHFYVCKRLKMHRYEKLDSYIVLSRFAFKKTKAKVQNYIFTLISTCFSDGQCVICGRFP